MVKIEVFLQGNNKGDREDLLDTWIFREKHDQGMSYSSASTE